MMLSKEQKKKGVITASLGNWAMVRKNRMQYLLKIQTHLILTEF